MKTADLSMSPMQFDKTSKLELDSPTAVPKVEIDGVEVQDSEEENKNNAEKLHTEEQIEGQPAQDNDST